MENLLLRYMQERTGKSTPQKEVEKTEGPVITISREYGCPGKDIANILAQALSKKNSENGSDINWKWISKEIIEEAAKELKLTPSLLHDLSDKKQRSFFENMALFFSDEFYPKDSTVKNTIAKFIHSAANQGNVIILGRAGEAITKNIKRSIHIKLEAPLEWRIEKTSTKYSKTASEAKKEIIEMDKRREKFRHYFEKDAPDINFFDISFNCMKMTNEEIVEMLIIIAETRGFV